jgi:hypothetical protein
VVIWATILAAVPGWVALGVSFEKSVLAWIAYVWAFVFFAIAWIALFWARVERFQATLARYLWLVGGPITTGLLIGSMEWLISNSLRNALWVALPALALAQLGFAAWATRASRLRKEIKELVAEVGQLTERNSQLQNERDWLIRVRCRKLADSIDEFLQGWDRHDPKNKQALKEYRNQFGSDVSRLINDLKNFDLWKPEVDNPQFLEAPEDRRDIQNFVDYLRWVHLGFPKEA